MLRNERNNYHLTVDRNFNHEENFYMWEYYLRSNINAGIAAHNNFEIFPEKATTNSQKVLSKAGIKMLLFLKV